MERSIDQDLKKLKEKILAMGGYVESAIDEATRVLIKGDPNRITHVFEAEERVNDCHIQVDELCLEILAQKQPVARDLRFVLSVVKINTDLERMGDQAINIAQNGMHYIDAGKKRSLIEFEEMTQIVRMMVRDALDAFVNTTQSLAEDVLKRDDQVDDLKQKIFDELMAEMQADSSQVKSCLDLILIARNLERLGDHATNIAEDVIFTSSGQDVRHRHGTVLGETP